MRKWLVTCILSVCLSPLLFAGSDWIGINTGLQYFKLKSLYYYDAEGGEYQMDSYLYEQISVSILFENSTYFTQTRGFGMNYGMGITFPRWSTQEGVTSQEDTWMVDSFLLKFGPTYRFYKNRKIQRNLGPRCGSRIESLQCSRSSSPFLCRSPFRVCTQLFMGTSFFGNRNVRK